jgi:hypothetical protein
MALSQTEICNQALQRIGAQRIMDILDEESKGARVCLNVFEATVREVAAAGDWSCLKKRAVFARLLPAPAFEWAYQYQLPADFVSLVTLNGVDYQGQPTDEWEIEGRVLLSDAEEAKATYIAYVEDTTQWDSLFTEAVVVLLASKIATPIRQDEGLAQALKTEYLRSALPMARQKNGNNRKRIRFDPCAESRFLRSRYNSTNG